MKYFMYMIDNLDTIGAFIVLISTTIFVACGVNSDIKTMWIASGAWLIKAAFDKIRKV